MITKHKVRSFLAKHPMAVLSTVSEKGDPHGAAIYFVADEKFDFYFITKTLTRKYQNVLTTQKAALTIADSVHQITVQVNGKVSVVTDDIAIDTVFKELAHLASKKHDWLPPVLKLERGHYVVLRLRPSSLRWADFKHSKVGKNSFVELVKK